MQTPKHTQKMKKKTKNETVGFIKIITDKLETKKK